MKITDMYIGQKIRRTGSTSKHSLVRPGTIVTVKTLIPLMFEETDEIIWDPEYFELINLNNKTIEIYDDF